MSGNSMSSLEPLGLCVVCEKLIYNLSEDFQLIGNRHLIHDDCADILTMEEYGALEEYLDGVE